MLPMETKKCNTCGRELPLTQFSKSPSGTLYGVCRECKAEKYRDTRYANSVGKSGGGSLPPFSDPDFDGKTIGEVWRMMCRAKKWLDSRGCKISLDGEYHEVIIKKLKKE